MNLSTKGFSGTVRFNHIDETLTLEVSLDNTTKCSDVRQLSGGERSFATLCLLLAFDCVIDTPFR